MVKTILFILLMLMIFEGLVVIIYTEKVKKLIKKIIKSEKNIKEIGYLEIIIALLILFLMSL